jgi:membrane-bound serine protease (ClpP class)
VRSQLSRPAAHGARSRSWPASILRTALSALTLCCTLALGQPGGTPAVATGTQADNIAIITIRGPIDQYTVQSVGRRMELAQQAGAQALVFEIDSPGGEVVAVLDICDMIKRSQVSNTVAWVNSKAYSGGAIVALACREIVTSDPATLGDALPIEVNSFGMLNELAESERQKFLSPLIAEVVDSARARGYDEKLVQGIVSRGVELWLVQHKTDASLRMFIGPAEYRLIFGSEPDRSSIPTVVAAAPREPLTEAGPPEPEQDAPVVPEDPTSFIAASPRLDEITEQVNIGLTRATTRPVLTEADRGRWTQLEYVSDGQTLIVLKAGTMQRFGLSRATVASDEDLKAYFGAKNLRRLEPSWSEAFTVFLTNWAVRALLIAVFLIGLFLEMTHPGLMVPGAVAAAALVGLLAPPLVVGMANWWEVAAVLAGIALIALEIFVIPGFGVTGITGLILLFGGLVGTFIHESPTGLFPDSAQTRNDVLYAVASMALALGTSGIAVYYLGKHFGTMPVLGRLVLKNPGHDDGDSDAFLAAMGGEVAGAVAPGAIGVAVTPLRPSGRVQIDDRIIDVVSELGFIGAGQRVRVVSVGEFRITVEPARPDEVPSREEEGTA